MKYFKAPSELCRFAVEVEVFESSLHRKHVSITFSHLTNEAAKTLRSPKDRNPAATVPAAKPEIVFLVRVGKPQVAPNSKFIRVRHAVYIVPVQSAL